MKFKCTKCGQTKPVSEFCKDKRRTREYSSHCKVCHNVLYHEKHPRTKMRQLDPGDTKQCSKCNEIKTTEQFYKADWGDGYTAQCKDCRQATARAWKQQHKKRIADYQKQWRAKNPTYGREYDKQWRAKHIERRRELGRQWYARHRDQVLAYQKRYYVENADQIKRSVNRYYHTRRGKAVSVNVRHKRRAAKQKSDITPEWLEQLYSIQTHCAYCGREFNDDLPPTLDHVMPLSKDGTHTRDNVVLACLSCNCSKGNRIIGNVYISPEFSLRLPGFLEGLL